jgi:Protein of unknown function (DUF2510)
MNSAPTLPGFYPDAQGAPILRWWDGDQWTAQTQPYPPAQTVVAQQTVIKIKNNGGCFRWVGIAVVAFAVIALISVATKNDGKKDASAGKTVAGVGGVANEIGDVSVSGKCDAQYGLATAGVMITNSSSKPSNYSIEVSFFDQSGVKIGDGVAYVQNVAPGTSAKDEAVGTIAEGSTLSKCKIANVDRTAAN